MVGGEWEERERHNGKAPIELGDESWVMSAAIKIISERQNQQVLDKELSRLLSIFPDASPSVAAADLASQLKKTSPGKALERVVHRYFEHGVPEAEQVEERERHNGKAPIELGDESWVMSAAIKILSERQNHQVLDKELSRLLSIFPNASPSVAAADLASQLWKTSPGKALERVIDRYFEHGVPKAEQVPHEGPNPDPPQAIEKPMDVFARPNLHRVGTSNHGERQGDFGYGFLPPEIEANYNLWTYYTLATEFPRYPLLELRRVLHENNSWFAPSYKAISADYTAALAAELRGQGRKRGRLQGYPILNMLPRDSTPQPHEPCYIFERELQSIQNASAEGAKLATEELKIDTGPQCRTHKDTCEGETCADIECGCCCSQCGTHMDACEGDTSANIECWWWCSDYRFEEMVQCAGGHLFCFTCLRRRIEEITSGGSQTFNLLPCMDTSGCEESIPWSEVKRALPLDVFAKYEQRQAEDAVVPQSI